MAKAKKLNAASPLTETLGDWAIKIRRKDGTAFFASGTDFFAQVFDNREDAIAYAEELCKHSERRRTKVVRVDVTIREIVKDRARLDAVKAREQT